MVLRAVILGFFISLVSFSAARADISLQRISIQNGLPVILIKGEFAQSDDPAALAREVSASGAKIVTFDSNGGNVIAAIAYGRMIRSLGLSTFQLRSAQCASACALAFVGGVVRKAEPGSIGVHQSSFAPEDAVDGRIAVAAVQAMTAQIMGYLIEMGVDPKLLQLSLSTPSDDMRYLTAGEMEAFKVTSTGELSLPVVSSNEPAVLPAKVSPDKKIVPAVTPAETPRKAAEPSAEDRALSFMAKYHDAWSRPNAEAVAFMETAYADSITFYGKFSTKGEALLDKQTFANRWPERAYSVKYGTEQVLCSAACRVSGVVEWYANSPARGRMSSGAAEFTLIWEPSTGKIVSEVGKVIATDRNVSGPTRIISQWLEANQRCAGLGDSREHVKACQRREAIAAKLAAVKWCYGPGREYAREMDWHPCEPASREKTGAANIQPVGSAVIRRMKPDAYPVRSIFSGKTKLPDFKGRDRDFKMYRTRIREGMRSGPNYAGHYSVIQIGCGTGCSFVIVADNKTGRPINFPRGADGGLYLELQFQLNSRLLTTQWAATNQGKCFIEFFDFDGQRWTSLKKLEIGPTEACYREIAENLH